jgi:hypothetical protein
MPKIPRDIVYELHPDGVIKEIKVEVHEIGTRYAIETFIGRKQWDVEVDDNGKVYRNKRD